MAGDADAALFLDRGGFFFTSRLAYNSEIIAILNAGVSFRRLLRPYLMAAGLLCVLHLWLGHFMIPMMNKVRLKFEHTYICRDKNNCDAVKTANLHLFIGPDTKVFMKYYQREDSSARDFRLEKFQNGRLVSTARCKTGTLAAEGTKMAAQLLDPPGF